MDEGKGEKHMSEPKEMDQIIEEITKNLPPKTVAIFQGTLELLNERADIASIKVADIALAAGIGKGTIYEYFSSKEEIIIKAMAYDFVVQIEKIRKVVFQKKTFQKKLYAGFDWIWDNFERRNVLVRYINKDTRYTGSVAKVIEKLDSRLLDCANYNDIYEDVIRAGIQEGILKQKMNTFIIESTLVAVISIIVNYLLKKEYYKEYNFETVKDYAYQKLVTMLNDVLM